MKIGLLSDTHGYLDEKVFEYFSDCDELWHTRDVGSVEVVKQLESFKPLRVVYGNIDGGELRYHYPLDCRFECGGMDVWMTHIGGYPGRYNRRVKTILDKDAPQLFVCGHHGFHVMRTIVRFEISDGILQNLQVIELGRRGRV